MKVTKRTRRTGLHAPLRCGEEKCRKVLDIGMVYYASGATYTWCEKCFKKK